jgi:hypothetical protein
MPSKKADITKKPEAKSHRTRDIIISSVISIAITIVFGYYFLYLGIRERKPTFYIDPVRTTILDKTNAANAPLLLLKSNGDTVKADVTSVNIYFFNQGQETIKEENIYSPLIIQLGGSATLLDFKVLKIARAVSGIKVVADTLGKSLQIFFKALEKDDGFAAQLIFEGPKNTPIVLGGGIDGVKDFETHLLRINPLYFIIAIAILLIAVYLVLLLSKRYPKNSSGIFLLFSLIPILYLLLMFYKSEWFIHKTVPDTLMPRQLNAGQTHGLFDIGPWLK